MKTFLYLIPLEIPAICPRHGNVKAPFHLKHYDYKYHMVWYRYYCPHCFDEDKEKCPMTLEHITSEQWKYLLRRINDRMLEGGVEEKKKK